ncbi:MAG: 30S ribosomal protein S8 [Patescibacteria group bacterium]
MDTTTDALIRIKNGYLVGAQSILVKYSKLTLAVLKLLQKEGYLGKVDKKGNNLEVQLKYNGRVPSITNLKRVSRPSLRIYKGVNQLPKVMGGLGIAIISTPKGVMTDVDARKQNVGGEVLALVW